MSVKPLKQKKINLVEKTAQDGDCYRTCIAMLLGEDSPDKVPDFSVQDKILERGWPPKIDCSEFAMNEWLIMDKGYELIKKKCQIDNNTKILETIIRASRDEYKMPVMINISVAIGNELNFRTIESPTDSTKLFDHSIIIDAAQRGKTFLYDPDPYFKGEWDDKNKIKDLFPTRNQNFPLPTRNIELPHKRGYLPLSRFEFQTIFIGHIKSIPELQLNEKQEKCKKLCDSFRQDSTDENYSALMKHLGLPVQ